MKDLFIPENSGYGRFVTVTVNGKPYTVPVGVNVSVPDEVYSVVMESLKRPETDMGENWLYPVPNGLIFKNNILQLTANGEAVGNGATIPAAPETFTKTYFDYAKLKNTAIGNLTAFSIQDNFIDINSKDVYVRFEFIKDRLDESTGALVVQPVLTGLPSVIYGDTNSKRKLDGNETVGIELEFEYDGEKFVFSAEEFKEIFSNENTKFEIYFDNASVSYTIIIFEFSATYEDVDTANAVKSALKDETMPMFIGAKVAIDRVDWTEKESEIVYAE